VKEPAQIINPEYSVEKIVSRMQEAALRKGQLQDFASSEVVQSAEFRPVRRNGQLLAELDIQPFTLQPQFYPHSDGRYHVNDLLKYHDRTFIQNAYRAILKRGPDASGYKAFIESLRSARLNKLDILASLRYSSEGRAKKVEIEGLRIPSLIRKAYRVPFLGYLLNLLIALVRLPLIIRGEQQFAAHVLAQQELIADHLNHLGRTMRAHSGEVSQVLESQSELIKQIGSRLEEQFHELCRQMDELRQQQSQNSDEWRRQSVALTSQLAEQAEQIQKQIVSIVSEFEVRISETNRKLEVRINAVHRELDIRMDHEAEQRQSAENRLAGELHTREQEIKALKDQLAHWEDGLRSFQIRALQWRTEIAAAETELRQMDALQREQVEATRNDLKRAVDAAFEKQQAVTTQLVLQDQRVETLLREARLRLPAPFSEDQLQVMAAESEHRLDAFYAAFDEQFRGSRDEIKQRLRVYLPIIAERGLGQEELPILDIGCGRGEWLELLKDEQLVAHGVDSNRVLVEQCRARGLSVAEEDLLGLLRRQPDGSVGAITGFHIIEHLPLETLIDVLNETVRVLHSGGVVIFETPNPQNVLVGSCNFYFDPTHRNPIPSQVLDFLLQSRGFARVEILQLNPSDDTPVADDSELARRFNRYFYGPMDYAAVGWKA